MKFLKIFALLFVSCLSLSLLLIFITPFLLSTHSGQRQLENYLSYALHATVKIESLTLSWTGEQEIQHISIATPNFNFSSDLIASKDSLLKFVFSGCHFSNLTVNNPHLNILHFTEKKGGEEKSSLAFALILAKHLTLSSGSFTLQTNEKSLLEFRDIQLTLKMHKKNSLTEFRFSTQTFFEKESGKIDLFGAFDPSNLLKIDASITDLSMPEMDTLLTYFGKMDKPLLAQSFGETMNIRVHLDSTSSHIEAYVKSRFLNLHLNTENTTSPPLVFDWTINPAILQLFGAAAKTPIHLSSSFQTLNIPSLFDWRATSLKMKTTLSDLNINAFKIDRLECTIESDNIAEEISLNASTQFASTLLFGQMHVQGFIKEIFATREITFKAYTNSLTLIEPFTGTKRDVSSFSCEAPISPSPSEQKAFAIEIKLEDTLLPTLLGNSFEAHLSSFLLTSKNELVFKDFILGLNSDLMKGALQGSYDVISKGLRLTKDGYIDYKLSNTLFAILALKGGFPSLKLDKETLVTFLLEKNSSTERLNAHIFSEDCTLISGAEQFPLHNIDAVMELKNRENRLSTKAQMTMMKEGFITAFIDTNLQTGESLFKVQGKKIPIELVKSMHPSLSYIVGEEFDLLLSIKNRPSTLKEIDFDLSSKQIKMKGGINLSDALQVVAVTTPIKIDFTLTPSCYKNLSALSQKGEKELFQLRENATLSCTLGKWRLDENQGFPSLEFKALATLKNFAIAQKESWLATTDLSIQMEKKRLEAAKGSVLSAIASNSGRSDVTGNFELSNFDIHAPLVDALAKMHLTLDLNVIKLPTILIDALLQPFIDLSIATYLGSSLNAKVMVDSEKDLKKLLFEVDSSASSLYLNGIVSQNRLFLNVPIKASIELTPALTTELYDTFGFSLAKSSVPLSLEVASQGFIMPIISSPLMATSAPSVILDLGKMVAINKGTLDGVNSLFKIKGDNTMQIWFAPLEMHLKNGLLYLDRTEILLDGRYHICLWGTIDLAKKWVKLTVGLTAQSLKKALGISNLPESYVLQVPLEGPFGNVELKKGSVVAKIALLIGSTPAPTNTLFGGVLKGINSIMNDQSSVPKAKRPYPWERELSLKEEQKPIMLKQSKQKTKELIHF